MKDYKGKVCGITGAASGIGKAFAQHRKVAAESGIAAQLIIDRIDNALHLFGIGHKGRGIHFLRVLLQKGPLFTGSDERRGSEQCKYK